MIFLLIILIAFIAVVQSYTFTTIKAGATTSSGAHPLVIDAGQTYAYTTDDTGTIYRIHLTTGISTTILTNGAGGNCYAIGLYGPNSPGSDLLFGGYNLLNNYRPLTTSGTKTVLFGSGGIAFPAGTTVLWANGMVTDETNKIMYISDTNTGTVSSSFGAIWKLDFSAAFTSNSLVKLALTLNGAAYTPGTPNGLSLVGNNLYFIEESGNRVCKVDVTSLAVTQIITAGLGRPFGIAVDSSETYAYVSTWTTPPNAILKVDLAANTFTNIATYPASVTALIMETGGQNIFMTAGNDLVKMDLIAPPTPSPTFMPSKSPTFSPSFMPSLSPTFIPTAFPTSPTSQPSSIPSNRPTSQPSLSCPIGSYIKVTGRIVSCEKCENGYMSTTVRATTCEICAAGTYSDFATFTCADCAVGYFSTEGTNECEACPIGFYSDITGATICNACPAGRTTALTASISAASCQSPATSFAFGIVGLFVAIIMIVNVISSRFHITSFARRIRIVDPISRTCKTLMTKLDSIKRAMFIHKFKFMKDEEEALLLYPNHLRTLHNVGKMFLIMMAMLLLLMTLMMIFFGQYLLRIFYQTFVLWRGLRFNFSLNPDFLNILNSVLAQLAAVIDVPFIDKILLVFYPIVMLLAKLSTFHLNLSSVNVSCSGSQAPLEVMINVVILGLFAVYIESNYQVLIAAPVAEILRSSTEIVMFYKSRMIMDWSFLRWFSSLLYLGIIRMILSLKPMASSLQYLMSFVSVQTFIPFHAYSDACDNIANFIGIDSALANLCTALIYSLIAPVIYTVACVIVPGLPSSDISIPFLGRAITKSSLFHRDHFYFANDERNQWRERYTCFYRMYSALKTLMSPDVMFMFLFAFQNIHILVNQVEEILGLKSIVEGLKDSSNHYYDDKIVLANIVAVESINTGEPSSQSSSSHCPASPYKSSRFKDNFFPVSEDDVDDDDNMNDDNDKTDVNELRRNFSRKKSDNTDMNDSDIFSYGKLSRSFSRIDSKSWADVGANVAMSKVEEVVVLTSFCVDELKVVEVDELKKIKSTTDRFPSYYTLSRWTLQDLWEFWECNDDDEKVADNNDDTSGAFNNVTMTTNSVNTVSEESKNNKGISDNILLKAIKLYIKRAAVIFFSFTFFGHMSTETGRSAYTTIFWKAYIMMKVSFGFWNDDCMQAFDADQSFSEMVLGDTDEKNMGDILEAIVGIRSVLFQLIPGLTLLSVYVQSTSKSPIYITNKRLLDCVPSFLMSISQARELAIETELRQIGEDHRQLDKYSQYNIQEWAITMLTLNIFVTKCRFVSYFIGALSVAMSVSVVFGTAASNLDTTSTASYLTAIILVLLVLYVPYSFFLSLQYLVVFGKILHLRDSDFWFDFLSVWIWMKESCCKSNTMELIKLLCLVLAADEESADSEVTSTRSKVNCEEEPTFEPRIDISDNGFGFARIDINDNGDGENSLNDEVDSNDDRADIDESASLNLCSDEQLQVK